MGCPLKKVARREGDARQLLEKYKNLGQMEGRRKVKRGVQGRTDSNCGRMRERKNMGTRKTKGQEYRPQGEGGRVSGL